MYKNKRVLAIITARGGSKRLPNKNILDLAGKPLIAWSIIEGQKTKVIDTLIVSTDSTKIAGVCRQYGVEIPFIRPKELATDTATSIDVVKHAVSFYKAKEIYFDFIIILQPTSPLRIFEDIDDAFNKINDDTRCIVSVCKSEHPPLWSNTLPEDLSMKDFIPTKFSNKRSQDLPTYYRLNGAIYISEINYLIENNGFFGKKTKAFIMPQERSVDIDSEIDFEFCRLMKKKNIT